MLKRIMVFGIAMAMLFSMAAVSGCNSFNLSQHKTDAKAELDAHVATKVESDYVAENWKILLEYLTNGKTAIDEATNKLQVNTEKSTAIQAINGVEKETDMGNQIPFETGVFGGGFFDFKGNATLSAVIHSQKELESFFEGYDIQFTTPIWERYKDDFFESHALALHFFWATSTDFIFSVEDVRMGNDAVKLYLRRSFQGDSVNDGMQFVPIVLEINKSDIGDVSDMEVIIGYGISQGN